jgi:MFS transporter, DHA1 family, inner membrane transport protein
MTIHDLAWPRLRTFEGVSAISARTSPGRWLLPVLVAATFISLVHYIAFSPLLPLMADDLGVTVGALGQVPAAIGLGAGLLGLIVGPLADQYGHRRALVGGLLALVASSDALAVSPGLAILPVAALLGAAGRATVYPVVLAVAGTRFDGDARRQAISRLTTSLSVAPILGIPALTAIADAFGWRAAFLVAAGVTVVVLLVVNGVLAEGTQAKPNDAPPVANFVDAYRPLLAHRSTLGVIGATFLLSAGGWIAWTYLGAFAVERHGFSTQQAGWAWLVVGFGLLGGGLLGGSRLGKAPLRPLLVAGAVGAGVCLTTGLALPLSGWTAIAAIALGTLMHGLTQVASAVLLSQETPAGHAATMTLRGSAQSLGAALGSAAGGVLLPLAGFPALGLCALVCCLGGALLALPLPDAKQPAESATCDCAPCLAKAPV